MSSSVRSFKEYFSLMPYCTRNHNTTARILNSTLHNETDQLAPLVNPQTNAPVANFPLNSAALAGLSCKLYPSSDICTSNILFTRATKESTRYQPYHKRSWCERFCRCENEFLYRATHHDRIESTSSINPHTTG